jgi:hypothetical protein
MTLIVCPAVSIRENRRGGKKRRKEKKLRGEDK